jgi:hypothetical protein
MLQNVVLGGEIGAGGGQKQTDGTVNSEHTFKSIRPVVTLASRIDSGISFGAKRCVTWGRRMSTFGTKRTSGDVRRTTLYVRCCSRAASSLGMSSITLCPHASSSCHQRRSPALA